VDGYAAEVKKVVKTPVVAVGAFSDPALMESVLADGTVDMIAIARGLIADPDIPNKARQGKDEDINQCLRCYTCFSGLLETKQFCCAINPVRHTGGIPEKDACRWRWNRRYAGSAYSCRKRAPSNP